jgi:hypothetical protein
MECRHRERTPSPEGRPAGIFIVNLSDAMPPEIEVEVHENV